MDLDTPHTSPSARPAAPWLEHPPETCALDRELAVRLRARDAAALAEIYDEYGPPMYALALRIVGDPTSAEDVTHDVFIKLWRSPGHYQPERGPLRHWLLRVTHNRAIDHVRRQHPGLVQPLSAEREDVTPARGPRVADDPTDQVLMADAATRMHKAIAQLPPAQRQAIELAFLDGKTHTEIAAELSEPLGTVKTRVRLGVRRLRGLLATMDRLPQAS